MRIVPSPRLTRQGVLVLDRAGNVYGTTQAGGAHRAGDVYKAEPGRGEFVLHSFCGMQNCADGETPIAGLIRDASGTLYGTTYAGGVKSPIPPNGGGGTVFAITPEGAEAVLYTFFSVAARADGSFPAGGLVMDRIGNLYGTTTAGGGPSNGGVAFVLSPDGAETVLYDFCSAANCTDGNEPMGSLVLDGSGDLYGTTYSGGARNQGTVFRVARRSGETVLHSFCSVATCADGQNPVSGLILDAKGNLYGTTTGGGAQNHGTVFEVIAGPSLQGPAWVSRSSLGRRPAERRPRNRRLRQSLRHDDKRWSDQPGHRFRDYVSRERAGHLQFLQAWQRLSRRCWAVRRARHRQPRKPLRYHTGGRVGARRPSVRIGAYACIGRLMAPLRELTSRDASMYSVSWPSQAELRLALGSPGGERIGAVRLHPASL